MMPDEAVLLIGGLGTRLGNLTKAMPKPMLAVAGKPFLEYLLGYLKRQGIRRFILAAAHRADVVRGYFGDGLRWGIEIVYSDPDGRQLGTGGSIKEAEELIRGKEFFALNGDIYFEVPLEKLWSYHREKRSSLSLALFSTTDTGRYGSVSLSSDGVITDFFEKNKNPTGRPCLVNGGIYVFNRSILKRISKGVDFSLEYDLFPKIAGKTLYGLEFPAAFFIDIGTPQDYERAQTEIPRRNF
ncbi:MAG: nucleotidyltransferase family protein [Elusimicrobia bacterium]|nr:nucleotidyltransferase family protein [Elusimicrobiota bacterium]